MSQETNETIFEADSKMLEAIKNWRDTISKEYPIGQEVEVFSKDPISNRDEWIPGIVYELEFYSIDGSIVPRFDIGVDVSIEDDNCDIWYFNYKNVRVKA